MKRKILPYKPYLKEIARKLRKNMTLSEVLLWNELKQKQLLGYDFDRQRPIDAFIVDFYCKDIMLAIEIDGQSHNFGDACKADAGRQQKIEDFGVSFLRFSDEEVKKDMPNVLRTIEKWIVERENTRGRKEPTPNPSREGLEPTPCPSEEGNKDRAFSGGLILMLLFLCSGSFAQGPYAPPAGQPGSTAVYKDSSVLITWATGAEVIRGPMDIANPDSGDASAGTEASAIGKAGKNGVVSLGDGGMATLTFSGFIYNGEGADFAVFENSFSDDFLELAFVEVSSDGINFIRFPAVSLTQDTLQIESFGTLDATNLYNLAGKYRAGYGTPFDLEELKDSAGLNVDSITHVRIIDVTGNIDTAYATYDSKGNKVNDPWPTAFTTGGFDLDAVGVIHFDGEISAMPEISNEVVKIYPNPAKEAFFIEGLWKEEACISLMDAAGRSLLSFKYTGVSEPVNIPVSGLEQGFYYLQITNKGKSSVKKILLIN